MIRYLLILFVALAIACSDSSDDDSSSSPDPTMNPDPTVGEAQTAQPAQTATPSDACVGGEDSDPDVEPACCPEPEIIPLADII